MPTTTGERRRNRNVGSGGPRVLIITEDAEASARLGAALEQGGFAGRTAASLPAALNLLSEGSCTVIVLDLDLRGMEGPEALRRLRATGNRTPVIVMTADSSVQTAIECGRLEVVEYLEKPVAPEAVVKAVKRYGDRMGRIQNVLIGIGKNVRRLRSEAGLTLKALAERADTSISLISHVELARASASIGTLLRIANALGVDIKTLFDDPRD